MILVGSFQHSLFYDSVIWDTAVKCSKNYHMWLYITACEMQHVKQVTKLVRETLLIFSVSNVLNIQNLCGGCGITYYLSRILLYATG